MIPRRVVLHAMTDQVLDLAYDIVRDPDGWKRECARVLGYWLKQDYIPVEDLENIRRASGLLERDVLPNMWLLEHCMEDEYKERCAELFVDMFLVQKTLEKIEPPKGEQ